MGGGGGKEGGVLLFWEQTDFEFRGGSKEGRGSLKGGGFELKRTNDL